MAACARHSLFLSEDGVVWGCGKNRSFQLGSHIEDSVLGSHIKDSVFKPIRIEGMPPIKTISCAPYTSFFIDEEDELWFMGEFPYSNGKLNHAFPTKVEKSFIITQIACNGTLTILLDHSGNVWKHGEFRSKITPQLTAEFCSAKRVEDIPAAQAVYIGNRFVVILCTDGSVWGTFDYDYKLGYYHSPSGYDGIAEYRWMKLEPIPEIRSISCGSSHVLFVSTTNEVWAYGSNNRGQLGLKDKSAIWTPTLVPLKSPIISTACGNYHSLFLDCHQKVWACGSNDRGQLGFKFGATKSKPKRIPNLPPISSISAGLDHSIFISEEGIAYGCGCNREGALGFKTKFQGFGTAQFLVVPIPLPIKVKSMSSLSEELANYNLKSAKATTTFQEN